MKSKSSSKDWSYFVYMAGDNNLSNFGLRDISEMELTGSTKKTNVIVEIDTEGGFEGVIRYQIPEINPVVNKANRIVLERLGEKDSGDPKTLVDFLNWSKKNFSAKNYCVVVWNHGSGFRGARLSHRSRIIFRQSPKFKKMLKEQNERAIASDDMTGNALDMKELANALKKSGFSGNNKIQVLGFDACLMNMLEVAYDMSPYANYLVGSEDLEPGDGADYTANVNSLNKSGISAEGLTKEFVNNFSKFYNRPSKKSQWPITQSGINLKYTKYIAQAVNRLAKSLLSLLPDGVMTISAIREEVQFYAPIQDFDDYVDLGDLADLCAHNIDNAKVQKDSNAVKQVLKKAIVANISHGEDVKYSHGLTIWFPETQHKFRRHESSYKMLTMTKKFSNWHKFLHSYHRQAKIKNESLSRSSK